MSSEEIRKYIKIVNNEGNQRIDEADISGIVSVALMFGVPALLNAGMYLKKKYDKYKEINAISRKQDGRYEGNPKYSPIDVLKGNNYDLLKAFYMEKFLERINNIRLQGGTEFSDRKHTVSELNDAFDDAAKEGMKIFDLSFPEVMSAGREVYAELKRELVKHKKEGRSLNLGHSPEYKRVLGQAAKNAAVGAVSGAFDGAREGGRRGAVHGALKGAVAGVLTQKMQDRLS